MATNDLEKDEIFNCTICLERFRTPKYLPCLHTFCQPCLNTYILSSTRESTTPPTSFNCPICRAEVKPPQESLPIEEWAELMPLNNTLYSLMDKSGSTKQPEEGNCDHCERDGESTEAKLRCFDCRENLCETCTKYHKRQKASVYHRIVPICEMMPEEFEIADVEEPCTEHKGEMLKVYCVDHREMCCVICLSLNHRKCENIKTIDEMAENMMKIETVQQLKNKISDICCTAETLIVQKSQNIDSIEKQRQNFLSQIPAIVSEAKAKLDNFYEKFKKQISLVQKQHITKLMEVKERLENFQTFLSYCEKNLDTVTKFGSPKQCFVTVEKIRRHIDIQGKEIEEFLMDDQSISYKLVLDKHLTIMTSSMTSVAEVEVQTTPHDKLLVFTTEDVSDGIRDLQRQLRSADISNLKPVKEWDIRIGGRISSGLFLEDGKLVCVDYDMGSINVYETKGKLLALHPLDFKPWGISQSSDGRFYVSRFDVIKGICVFPSTNFFLNEEKCITTNFSARAVNMTEGTLLIQSNTEPESIHSVALDGQSDRELCKCSRYSGIAVRTSDGESVFFHCEDKAVVCRTLDGTEVFRHDLPDIVSSRGVALDAADNVYVCGRDSNEIYVISKDGSSSQVFMSGEEGAEGCSEPYAIGFNKTGTKFFVSWHGNKSVAVYDLTL